MTLMDMAGQQQYADMWKKRQAIAVKLNKVKE